MNSVRSKDGTTIAFDQLGEGPPIILAGGAFSYRAFPKLVQRRSDATRLFMTKAMGIPGPIVRLMRFSPIWSKLTATAHTLPYDWALLGDTMSGKPLSRDDWASATVPTLVLAGEKSPEQLRNAARAIAGVLPNAEHRELEGQSHNPSMKVMAPVLREFLSDRDRSRLHPAA